MMLSRKFVIFILLLFAGILVGDATFVVSSHSDRQAIVVNQRAGCEIGKEDRTLAAFVSTKVLERFRAEDAKTHHILTKQERADEARIQSGIDSQHKRAKRNCVHAYPDARWFPALR